MLRVIFHTSASLWLALASLACVAAGIGQTVFAGDDRIAFETDRDGNWEVYVLDVRTGLAHNLTRHPAADHAPSWSPDGRSLTFHSNRESSADIYTMDYTGSEIRRLTLTGQSWRPRWSPDGTRIAYMWRFNEVYVMNVDGSEARYVATGFSPEWSPDASKLVYYVNQGDSLMSDIHIVNADGSNRRNITNSGTNDWGPVWLPDGRSVAFVSSQPTGLSVYVLNTDCTPAADTPCVQPLALSSAIDRAPTWSPDGMRIAFDSVFQWQSHIYIMNADGTGIRRLTSGTANDQFPVWSP